MAQLIIKSRVGSRHYDKIIECVENNSPYKYVNREDEFSITMCNIVGARKAENGWLDVIAEVIA